MRFPSLVFLAQTITSPMVAFPIHLFFPLSSQPPSVFVAVVYNDVASLPKSGSVNPKQKIFSNLMPGGRSLDFCSSSPSASITAIPIALCTNMKVEAEPSRFAISYMHAPASNVERPGLPYPLIYIPFKPSGLSLSGSHAGNVVASICGSRSL